MTFVSGFRDVADVCSFICGGEERSTTFVSGLRAYDDVFIEQ